MRLTTGLIAVVCVLSFVSGCSFLGGLLGPTTTSVRLVNDGDFDVEVVLYYGDDQDALEEILTEFGTRMEFTLSPGESTTLTRDCDDLQAVVIDNAELRILGAIGPEAGSDVQRDGSDFGCGATITFTFDHGPLFVDFDVSVSVTQ